MGAGFISAIGVLDRNGPRLLLAGPALQSFPELARGWSLLVTFNGRPYGGPLPGYGTHGEVVFLRPEARTTV